MFFNYPIGQLSDFLVPLDPCQVQSLIIMSPKGNISFCMTSPKVVLCLTEFAPYPSIKSMIYKELQVCSVLPHLYKFCLLTQVATGKLISF